MKQTGPTRMQRTPGLRAGKLHASNRLLNCTACCATVPGRSPAGAASQAEMQHPAARHHLLLLQADPAAPEACCSAAPLLLSMLRKKPRSAQVQAC